MIIDTSPFFSISENIAEESISPVIRQRKTSAVAGGHDDIDDFEMISEEELAEVSP